MSEEQSTNWPVTWTKKSLILCFYPYLRLSSASRSAPPRPFRCLFLRCINSNISLLRLRNYDNQNLHHRRHRGQRWEPRSLCSQEIRDRRGNSGETGRSPFSYDRLNSASMRSRRMRLARVWYPLPFFFSHAITSASSRSRPPASRDDRSVPAPHRSMRQAEVPECRRYRWRRRAWRPGPTVSFSALWPGAD